MPKQLLALLTFAFLVVASTAHAHAQAWPERPIRILTAGAAGSGIDILTRTLAQHLQTELGQSVVVDNKPGANQILVSDLCARSAPDGYTFCTTSIEPYASNPALFKKLPYDPEKSFSPVAMLVTLRAAILMRADIGAKTLQEAVAISKQKPGKLNWGSTGIGSNSHLYLESIRAETGWDVTHVPYKSTVDSMQALMANEVQFIYQQVGPVQAQVDSGLLLPIAFGGEARSAALPNAPTFNELGIGMYRIPSWWGMVAPAGTPADIVDRVSRASQAIMHRPELRSQLTTLSVDPARMHTPAEMRENMRVAREIAHASFKRANVQPN